MRPIGHPVAVIERPSGPQPKPHPDTTQNILEYGETQQTCETSWRIRQGKEDRSTDRMGAPLHVTLAVTPDMAVPTGPNTVDKAHLSCVVI